MQKSTELNAYTYSAHTPVESLQRTAIRIDKGNIKGLALAGLLLDLEKALGCSVDLITTTSLDKEFLSSIKNDEVLLYEAS